MTEHSYELEARFLSVILDVGIQLIHWRERMLVIEDNSTEQYRIERYGENK